MSAAQEHRGPDQRGSHFDGPVGLGIQRLAVVDTVHGDQPVANEDGSVVVVLNGEIYDYQSLRRRLRQAGHRFSTGGDTETIVHLYEDYGVDCVKHLHGMFAFALWDARRRLLLLARDRVGKKPLFYAPGDGALTFASELGALMQDHELPRRLDPVAIDRYLAFGYVPAPLSAFAGVRKLEPGRRLIAQDGRLFLDRYWQLDFGSPLDVGDEHELEERIREELRAATRRRMVADVPIGAFLSGGIDSSAVVAAMAECSSAPVRTFSIGFDHEPFDELPQARRIAQLFGTDHEEFVVRPDAIAIVPRIVRHYGEPFADSSAIPTFLLSELTSRHVTVALTGDGGDECFAGYTRFVANTLAARLDGLPAGVRRAAALLARRLPAGESAPAAVARARRLGVTLGLDPAQRYAAYVLRCDAAQRRALYDPAFLGELGSAAPAESVITRVWDQASGDDVLARMLEVDGATHLPDDLIAKVDIATMAHGLEARSPFLDADLMQLAASIPSDLKIRGREKKWILRRALRGWIPDEILDRPKQGFSVPMGDWLAGELHADVREVLLDPVTLGRGIFDEKGIRAMLGRVVAGDQRAGFRVWSLYMLETWQREFLDRAAPAPVPAAAVSSA
ncbi:Asparagine synthetase [glutamine-hydrolyzing] 1 [Capillimicrobium parvum]|uniref:asparagine synthase (glutamine-hydrolyzing) n=2 Tax=Capillimicrobium parvum TaxID=2884022 RepID=A0A9E6Y099_9ACTN|nr:Asparagine synthetase [glutamine-hydrolyzing] 1 [Capillimicrobium parvum]